MSLRLRAVCRRPATSSPQAATIRPVDIEEEILVRAVIGDRPHLGLGDRIQRKRIAWASAADTMRCVGEHDEMRVVQRHQREQENWSWRPRSFR